MDFSMPVTSYIFLAVIFFIAGIIDAAAGGGGLITLPAFMLTGFPIHLIAGTNQASCVFGGLTATFQYMKKGKIYWQTGILSGVFSIAGSFWGSKLNMYLPEKYLQIIMIILIPISASIIFLKRNIGRKNEVDSLSLAQKILFSVFFGLFMGMYIGFYGAAGGTFLIFGFVLLNKLDLITASGNAKVCGMFATLTATATYTLEHHIVWPVVFIVTIANIAGNFIGAKLAIAKGEKFIKPLFIVVLALLFCRLILTLFCKNF